MSLFSTGGASFPDLLIVLILAILASFSLFISPIVFFHNYRKPMSIPKVLFLMLNVLDFMTCMVFPAMAIYSVTKVEPHPKCARHAEYGVLCEGWLGGSPSIITRFGSLVTGILYQSPSCVTALLTICRLRQLQHPFRFARWLDVWVHQVLFNYRPTYQFYLWGKFNDYFIFGHNAEIN